MSEPPPFDPESTVHQGDVRAFTRRKAPMKRYLWPALAGIAITALFILLVGWIGAHAVGWVQALFSR